MTSVRLQNAMETFFALSCLQSSVCSCSAQSKSLVWSLNAAFSARSRVLSASWRCSVELTSSSAWRVVSSCLRCSSSSLLLIMLAPAPILRIGEFFQCQRRIGSKVAWYGCQRQDKTIFFFSLPVLCWVFSAQQPGLAAAMGPCCSVDVDLHLRTCDHY